MRIQLDLRRTDASNVSPSLELTALLVDAPDVPLILGWAGLLDRARLMIDAPHHTAWLAF